MWGYISERSKENMYMVTYLEERFGKILCSSGINKAQFPYVIYYLLMVIR